MTELGIRSRLTKPWTFAAMSLGYGVVQLDVTIVNTVLNSIGSSLGGGVSELQWIVSTYTIAFAAFILTAGALGDRLGAKGIFMAGFSIFTLASLACALAPNSAILIAARAVQGLGAAILVLKLVAIGGGLGLLVPLLTSTCSAAWRSRVPVLPPAFSTRRDRPAVCSASRCSAPSSATYSYPACTSRSSSRRCCS